MQANLKGNLRKGVLSLFVVLAVSAVMFLILPHIKFGPENLAPFESTSLRLIGIIVLLVIWGLWMLWMQPRQDQSQTDPDSGDTAGVGKDAATASSASSESYRSARSNRVMLNEFLQSRSKQKGSPYERPWYLVIGRKGAGKQGLLAQSGLDISRFGTVDSGGDFSGTGSRWWFADEAVFVDTGVPLERADETSHDTENRWQLLLETLRQYRKRRPVNGVILVCDFSELTSAQEDERAAFAMVLRRRLRELTAQLNMEVPVYLVCTKMDMVPGFQEFFADSGHEERDQVWGVSLSRHEAAELAGAEFLTGKLQELSTSLYTRMLARLNRETDANLRCEILAFPRHFAGARNTIAKFSRDLFKSTGTATQACLRGIYFTAAEPLMEQSGALFPSVFAETRVLDQASKSFFVRKLFQDLIVAEPDIAGFDIVHERFLIASRYAAMALAAILCVSVGLAWAAVTSRHGKVVESFQAQLKEYEAAKESASGTHLQRMTQALDTLWNAVIGVSESGSYNPFRLGLEDDRLAKNARTAYLNELQNYFLPHLLDVLEQKLVQSQDDDETYETLRTYLMFEHLEYMDKERVSAWFGRYWSGLNTTPKMQTALSGHLQRLLAATVEPCTLDPQRVADARSRIARIPLAQRIYERIQRKPEHLRIIDLSEHLGTSPHIVFDIDAQKLAALQIPVFFTREGRGALVAGLNSPQVTALAGESWVMGDAREAAKEMHAADMQRIRREVSVLYADDYARVWEDAVEAFELAEIRSLQQLEMLLRNLQDGRQSSLWNFLRLLAMHTGEDSPAAATALADLVRPEAEDRKGEQDVDRGVDALVTGGRSVAEKLGVFDGAAEFATVTARFRDLNRLAATELSGEAPAGGLADHLRALHGWVAGISSAADPGGRAFAIVAARYGDAATNPAMSLHNYAQAYPAPVRDWLERLADESWRLVAESARQHLSAAWAAQVHEPWRRTLQGRYPLNGAANEEVAVHDFIQFFRSGGTLDQYYEDYLAPFIVTTGQWRNRTVDRQSLDIPANLLRRLQQARKIRDAFFRNEGSSVSLTFDLRPYAMDESDARFAMDVGDQRLTYSHGPRFWTSLTWQATGENLPVRLAFEDLRGTWRHRDFDGVWAWLRLLDASYVEKTGDQSAYLVTFAMDDRSQSTRRSQKIVYEIKTQGVDNPLRRDMLTTFDLPGSF